MPRNDANLAVIRQFQSETDAIREAPEPKRAQWAVRLMALFLVTAVAVTYFARIDKVITSSGGKLVSTIAPSVFGALDPSIIKTIDVKEGQEVATGQQLATLDPTFAAADVGQLKQQIASLTAQIARAKAELEHKTPRFSGADDPLTAPYIGLQRALFDQRKAALDAQLGSDDAKIEQAQATIAKLQSDEVRFSQRQKIALQVQEMRDKLAQSGAGSKLNLLLATDQQVESLRALEFGHNSLIEARHSLASLRADRDNHVQQWFATASQEIVTAQNSLDTARAQLEKAAKHQDLVRLTAPEPSMVLQVAKLSVGSVLKEGDQLLTLMPLKSPVEAEIHIPTRDVGFVRAGDPTTLKIDAFNFFEHGTAEGHLTWISGNAFTTDDDGKPVDAYYKARIKIDSMHFVRVPANFRLIPGMTLSADVKIGTRSVAAYLLGGFFRGIGESMREP